MVTHGCGLKPARKRFSVCATPAGEQACTTFSCTTIHAAQCRTISDSAALIIIND
jgi:hypothetical protein